MTLFTAPDFDGHERVIFVTDAATGLRAIVAIHNTSLGPALGGCRMWSYAHEADAIADALRLSRAMTYKAALAGLALGGGKSVILGDPARHKSPELFRAFGRAVDALGGRYIVAEDVGTTVEDMDAVRTQTSHVGGISAGVGDPSPKTAAGVLIAMKAAWRHMTGSDCMDGVRVAIQGLGHVGASLARMLSVEGARLVVSDIDTDRAQSVAVETGATRASPDAIHRADADIFAPCAMGAGLDDATIPELRVRLVCGAANNQLAKARHGEALRARGVVYVPDYLANAGGLIEVARTALGYDAAEADARRARIADTVGEILARAEREGRATSDIADRIAEERFARA
ncbi:Leu/Phe/Val dehydrogenase [Futiania mangrovi]|uniref:Amino acid dehydrogenase n=1 Tax=Futiania mangrovi TaxID=2959716 RepID=A0A9J6PCH4_9PROT|nr:Glu/Leu/Phe/Val dehydrogenase dimerization domain-containing protein [Futiania mangrovii]MCP1335966.1 amino acid dehydrogenase [Futiania mangrovii]